MERKQQRWEKAQSVLHKDDGGRFQMENAYGRLQYINEDSRQSKAKNGFVLEAKEAPGTPGHTEKEKHLDLKTIKKAHFKGERFLYSSETPFRDQAVFYDITEWERSREFMKCMKRMLIERGHRTLKDTFGFLEQEPDRVLKQMLEQERSRSLVLEEFDFVNKQIDTLNGRIQKKESRERQLCAELQLMIDRGKEEPKEAAGHWESAAVYFVQEESSKAKEGDSEEEEEKNGIERKNNENF